jgi:predicted glycosyltransferase involved in capsule biosynthesis
MLDEITLLTIYRKNLESLYGSSERLLKHLQNGSNYLAQMAMQKGLQSSNTIENCKGLTLATSCMNRNEFLLESLKSWIKLPFKKIIVVDWSSKVPVKETISEYLNDKRILVYRVERKAFYEHAGARNLKVALCDRGWILSIDCDIKVSADFSRHLYFNESETSAYYMSSPFVTDRGVFGTSIFHKSLYDTAGGCDENMHGWGYEDVDLYQKFNKLGAKCRDLISHTILHQSHGDDLRAVNTRVDSIWASLANNTYQSAKNSI